MKLILMSMLLLKEISDTNLLIVGTLILFHRKKILQFPKKFEAVQLI